MNYDGGGRGLIVVILSIVLGIIIRFSASSNTRLYIVSVFRNIVIWLLATIAISFVRSWFHRLGKAYGKDCGMANHCNYRTRISSPNTMVMRASIA